MRAPAATAASTALALVAAGWLAYAARPSIEVIRQNHTSSAKDLLPVYLGAHALAAGREATCHRRRPSQKVALWLRERPGDALMQ